MVKNLPAVQERGLIPGSGRSFGEESSNPLQYSCLENSMDRGAWQATVHGVAESQAGPSANPHSAMWPWVSSFVWSGFDPWVGKIPWRSKQLPTPVFWPGEFHGQRSLAGYCLWGHKELDTTERLSLSTTEDPSEGVFKNPIFSKVTMAKYLRRENARLV